MSKQRYLDTKFWDDSYIINKDPVEKLLFIYLLTNPLTNILGIYEISLGRIAFDTGIEQEMVLKILERFEKDNKVKYYKSYIALKNFTKYQKNNPKINKGIEILLKNVPKELIDWVNIDFNRLSIDYDSLSHPNTNPNTNPNPKEREIVYNQVAKKKKKRSVEQIERNKELITKSKNAFLDIVKRKKKEVIK
ncbi:hypothetical protein ES705_24658 [subsurface metagenome]